MPGTDTWTSNCQAYTLVGCIVGSGTCTRVSKCTPTGIMMNAAKPTIDPWVGNLSTIDIGNVEDGNGGKDLAKEIFTKLPGFCDDTSCKPNQNAFMDSVEAIIKEGEELLKPAMYLQEAQYVKIADQSIAAAIGQAQK